jgi:hypothetical protein
MNEKQATLEKDLTTKLGFDKSCCPADSFSSLRPGCFSMSRRGGKVSLRRHASLTPLPGHAVEEAGRRRMDGLLASGSGM